VIRCPCEDNTDHGLMIQCEACLVWQHSLCVGIREDKSVPAHYFCETCLPRNFDCICDEVRITITLQLLLILTKRIQHMAN
jgi:hypothetical protein